MAFSVLVVAVGLSHMTAQATNGYFQHGFGTHAKGMAGAGSAFPQDLLSVYNNPAGLTQLDPQLNLGVEVFMPDRNYVANNDFTVAQNPLFQQPFIPPGKFNSDNELFFIPSLGYSWDLQEKGALSLTLVGNGGMNTDYKTDTFRNFATPPGTPPIPPGFVPGFPGSPGNPTGEFTAGDNTGIDLAVLMVGLTWAKEVLPNHSVGISPRFVAQRIKVNGLQPFKQLSRHPDHVTNKGYDHSYGGGVQVGYLGTFFDRLNVAVSYQSEMWMSDFNEYKGLFAKEGEFNLPPMFKGGVALKVTPNWVVVGDFTWINYKQIAAVHNSNDISLMEIQTNPRKLLGGNDGLGFGWGNVSVWHIGTQYKINDMFTIRAGYSHGDEPWNNVNTLFNVLAPATIEDHASVGLTVNTKTAGSFTFAYTHAFENTIQGTSQLTGTQTGEVSMNQNDFELLWQYVF